MADVRVELHGERDDSYSIRIGCGLLDELPDCLREVPGVSRWVLITDHTVRRYYGNAAAKALTEAGLSVDVLSIRPGEASKTRGTKGRLEDRMLRLGCGRDTGIVALGGGVVGDLAGFIAATFNRGIPFVQVPTTLLAMVDSSIGGKTGVDTPAGKNLIGAFHQPRSVLIDLETLRTLPGNEFAAGMAEVVKHGVIADARYFKYLEEHVEEIQQLDPAALERVVAGSCRIKAAVVAADEKEGGKRAILNFGHTVGHAIETRAEYEMLHGEAVAIGMIYEAALAGELLGFSFAEFQRLTALLMRLGHDVRPQRMAALELDAEEMLATMRLDKKSRGGKVRMSLPERLGKMGRAGKAWAIEVEDELLRSLIAELHVEEVQARSDEPKPHGKPKSKAKSSSHLKLIRGGKH